MNLFIDLCNFYVKRFRVPGIYIKRYIMMYNGALEGSERK